MATPRAAALAAFMRRIRRFQQAGFIVDETSLAKRIRSYSTKQLNSAADFGLFKFAEGFRLQDSGEIISIDVYKELSNLISAEKRIVRRFNQLLKAEAKRTGTDYKDLINNTSAAKVPTVNGFMQFYGDEEKIQIFLQMLRNRSNIEYYSTRVNRVITNYMKTLWKLESKGEWGQIAAALIRKKITNPANQNWAANRILKANQGYYGVPFEGHMFDSDQADAGVQFDLVDELLKIFDVYEEWKEEVQKKLDQYPDNLF